MSFGEIVGLIMGIFFIVLEMKLRSSKNYKREDIKKWLNYPRTVARITGTVRKGTRSDYEGYYYSADLWIDGQWIHAKSMDSFYRVKPCEIGEELEVAYKPIKESQTMDLMMGTLTKTVLNKDWNEEKPRYYFKFMDESKYVDDEKKRSGIGVFTIFGALVLLVTICSLLGIIQ